MIEGNGPAESAALINDPGLCRRCVLAGDSHGFALGLRGFDADETPRLDPIAAPVRSLFGLNGKWPRGDDYWTALVDKARDTTVFLIRSGNQHLNRFLLAIGAPFDFHLASHPHVPLLADATLVPEALVRETLGEPMQNLIAVLTRLTVVPGCKPVVLGTPPPKGNDEKLRAMLTSEFHFRHTARELGFDLEAAPLTNPALRVKLWLVVQDLLKETAERAGCGFVPVPSAAMDDMGFLKEEFWENDVTHANERYGQLFWHHILAWEQMAQPSTEAH